MPGVKLQRLTRAEVFQIIDKEREYQDKTFDPYEVLDSGLTREERDREVLPHIELLRDYSHEAGHDWTFSHRRGWRNPDGNPSGSFQSARQIAKIAAIAVRALERMPVAVQLLKEGLR